MQIDRVEKPRWLQLLLPTCLSPGMGLINRKLGQASCLPSKVFIGASWCPLEFGTSGTKENNENERTLIIQPQFSHVKSVSARNAASPHMLHRSSQLLDPVDAYNRLAPFYSEIANTRKKYLESIERLIIARTPSGSRSLLDVGAGDGTRALRIAAGAGLDDVVLLEPSQNMVRSCPAATEVWPIRAEELDSDGFAARRARPGRKFDLIICLWNVLGHIRPAATRTQVLGELGGLLSSQGLLFVDVNHRYNIRSYGLCKTFGRFIYDQFSPGEANGDVIASWNCGISRCATYGHVFTHQEIRKSAAASHLKVEERLVVGYDCGILRKSSFEGNLLYVFRRSHSGEQSSNEDHSPELKLTT
ncbi:MAG: Methyltransferase type 12 [Acidobacteriaceae bacterium]|nr:Methyltransferase type 12 [Acidobacteriaceae bacterium]